MHTLHTLNKPPSDASLWQACHNSLLPGDGLLLIEGAVYAALKPEGLEHLNKKINLYFLEADLSARGLPHPAGTVDDAGFVALCSQYTKVVSWF